MSLRRAVLLAGCLGMAACASVSPARLPGREEVRDFALEARFALRITLPEQAANSSGGRLSWEHRNGDDHLLVANPLGVGMAEIDIAPGHSRLRTADGKSRESADADALMEDVTGQSLPITRLPAWLLGKAAPTTPVEKDASGRPRRFVEAGWKIDYAYGDDTVGALPVGLVLSRDQEIELRLRIEEWREAP
ncbi:MAG: lipoprotein insertase outer membrane protein LolB [Bacteroidota bacterium]